MIPISFQEKPFAANMSNNYPASISSIFGIFRA